METRLFQWLENLESLVFVGRVLPLELQFPQLVPLLIAPHSTPSANFDLYEIEELMLHSEKQHQASRVELRSKSVDAVPLKRQIVSVEPFMSARQSKFYGKELEDLQNFLNSIKSGGVRVEPFVIVVDMLRAISQVDVSLILSTVGSSATIYGLYGDPTGFEGYLDRRDQSHATKSEEATKRDRQADARAYDGSKSDALTTSVKRSTQARIFGRVKRCFRRKRDDACELKSSINAKNFPRLLQIVSTLL